MTDQALEFGKALARALHQSQYGHLPQRVCVASAPMPMAQKDAYRWVHPDATVIDVETFANADICRCPNCGFSFTCFKAEQ